MKFLRKLAHMFGVDRAIASGIVARAWDMLTGPVTLVLIGSHFSPELQGYYFTFSSLLLLRQFVDLHMGRVVLHTASHEWSSLGLDERGRIVGEPDALSRLVSLGRIAFLWYAVGAALFVLVLATGGHAFLAHSRAPSVNWEMPWLALCGTSGLALITLAPVAILYGCDQVAQVYDYRLVRGMVTVPVTWIAIVSGAELWTAAIMAGAGVAVDALFVGWRYRHFFRAFLAAPLGPRFHFWSDIWPLHWRFSAVGISDYFVTSLFVPVLFYYRGAVEAGQMGMTWRLVVVIGGTAYTWINARAPKLGILASAGDILALDGLFRRTTVVSIGVTILGSAGLLGVVEGLNLLHHPLASRMLPLLPTAMLVATTPLVQLYLCQMTYLRAHKREMFTRLATVRGVLVGFLVWQIGRRFGAIGISGSYLGVMALVILPWGTSIWLRCRREWHAVDAVTRKEEVGGRDSRVREGALEPTPGR